MRVVHAKKAAFIVSSDEHRHVKEGDLHYDWRCVMTKGLRAAHRRKSKVGESVTGMTYGITTTPIVRVPVTDAMTYARDLVAGFETCFWSSPMTWPAAYRTACLLSL